METLSAEIHALIAEMEALEQRHKELTSDHTQSLLEAFEELKELAQ